jgi:hypothetical protein
MSRAVMPIAVPNGADLRIIRQAAGLSLATPEGPLEPAMQPECSQTGHYQPARRVIERHRSSMKALVSDTGRT